MISFTFILSSFRPDALLELLQTGLRQCDILVTSGGVSMGERVSNIIGLAI